MPGSFEQNGHQRQKCTHSLWYGSTGWNGVSAPEDYRRDRIQYLHRLITKKEAPQTCWEPACVSVLTKRWKCQRILDNNRRLSEMKCERFISEVFAFPELTEMVLEEDSYLSIYFCNVLRAVKSLIAAPLPFSALIHPIWQHRFGWIAKQSISKVPWAAAWRRGQREKYFVQRQPLNLSLFELFFFLHIAPSLEPTTYRVHRELLIFFSPPSPPFFSFFRSAKALLDSALLLWNVPAVQNERNNWEPLTGCGIIAFAVMLKRVKTPSQVQAEEQEGEG